MDIFDIPLMSVLQKRMAFLGKRQSVLAQNVANADTPGFTPSDLKAQDFAKALHNNTSGLATTNPRHIALAARGGDYESVRVRDKEADPTGNTVSLEEEMIKVADTQAQYQAAINIYSKALSMMRTAIGKGGTS